MPKTVTPMRKLCFEDSLSPVKGCGEEVGSKLKLFKKLSFSNVRKLIAKDEKYKGATDEELEEKYSEVNCRLQQNNTRKARVIQRLEKERQERYIAVSYTHLTLPTICSV
eukprot:TRINITY_DN16297_c0_g1_i1.p1 TRINITY_DN16297_c0_g1~~TRINITY_DN16297_c0_g1_i1.p1  ORF type:complete len:110 (+),score=25.47 TRINITY_DN16297_c0_g1_i1:359-688(+)